MRIFVFLILFLFVRISFAWDGHFMMTYLALQPLAELEKSVPAESLMTFLNKERVGLVTHLAENEKWSRAHVPFYPPLPDNLTFKGSNDTNLVSPFLMAIRVNLNLKFPLFLQYPIGESHPIMSRPIPREQVMLSELAGLPWIYIGNPPLEEIKEGELVSPLKIIATAADEPDYGMDLDLWENNFSWFRLLYKWGKQPFGNDKIVIGTQAPFHMGFYYENSVIKKLGSNLLRAYPVYRHHLYFSLSQFAFKTGHPYWGFRFLGWSLHYAQDLTQPYHSTVAPNVSTAKLLYVEFLAKLGFGRAKQNLIQLINNRHYALENYTYHLLANLLTTHSNEHSFIKAMHDLNHDKTYPSYDDTYLSKVIAKESNAKSDDVDQLVRTVFPSQYVMDSHYIFYVTDPHVNLFEISQSIPPEKLEPLNNEIEALLKNFASHTRIIVNEIIRLNNDTHYPKTP